MSTLEVYAGATQRGSEKRCPSTKKTTELLAVVNVSPGSSRRSNGNWSVSYITRRSPFHSWTTSVRFRYPGAPFITRNPSRDFELLTEIAGSSTRPTAEE